MNKLLCLFAIACIILSVQAQKYQKIVHNTDPDAKCLDGTSPALYIHEGA